MGKLPSCISPDCLTKIHELNSENEVKKAVDQNMHTTGTTVDAVHKTLEHARQYIKNGAGKNKRILANNWDTSMNIYKQEMQSLPDKYKYAEQKYLSLAGWKNPTNGQTYIGPQAYKNKMYYDYLQIAENKKEVAQLENDAIINELKTLVKSYRSGLIYYGKMEDLLKIRQNENTNLQKALQEMRNVTLTNDRRVYYEDKERNSISYNRYILYYFFFGIYIFSFIFGKNPLMGEYTYKMPMFWLIVVLELLFVTFPFWVDWLVRQIFNVYRQIQYVFNNKAPRDVYTNM